MLLRLCPLSRLRERVGVRARTVASVPRAFGAPSSAFGTFCPGGHVVPQAGEGASMLLRLCSLSRLRERVGVRARSVVSVHRGVGAPRLRRALIRLRPLLPRWARRSAGGRRRIHAAAPLLPPPLGGGGWGEGTVRRVGDTRLRRALIRLRHLLPRWARRPE